MRLIDADKLTADSDFVVSHVALIKQCGMKHQSGCNAPTCEDCFARLFKYYEHLASTIEAEPTKKGIWLVGLDDIECSVCKWRYSRNLFFEAFIFAHYFPYCPFCGAKMELGYDEYAGR